MNRHKKKKIVKLLFFMIISKQYVPPINNFYEYERLNDCYFLDNKIRYKKIGINI